MKRRVTVVRRTTFDVEFDGRQLSAADLVAAMEEARMRPSSFYFADGVGVTTGQATEESYGVEAMR